MEVTEGIEEAKCVNYEGRKIFKVSGTLSIPHCPFKNHKVQFFAVSERVKVEFKAIPKLHLK